MCSRTGFSLFIGYINLIGNCFGSILCTILLVDKDIIIRAVQNGTVEVKSVNTKISVRSWTIFALVLCTVMTIISGLLVAGIIKRCHRCMVPWLLLAFINIVVTFVLALVTLFIGGSHFSKFIFSMIIVAIQVVVFHQIYKLYIEIRAENRLEFIPM